ncbi:DUF3375 domain-containing protein [soil metagenome]
MNLNFDNVEALRSKHPAWKLLRAEHAPLVISFLNETFVVPNERVIPQSTLVESLEDFLFTLRERFGENSYKDAMYYLNDWCSSEKAWLRKYYLRGSDEPQFDLTPSTEKAIGWITALSARTFIGTESRLLTLFELLRQMTEGTETDPRLRIAELKKRRDEIDKEISRIEDGDISLLDETKIRDRYQQFTTIARELLSDFREVEHNFRLLDRQTREKVMMWEGSKGTLLEEIMNQRDEISDSDQGKSFRAFWDFLMSSRRQEELTVLLDKVLTLPAVSRSNPDPRMRRIHYDWLQAGEHTQGTVALLSQQLRRFLDDAAWLENRRIMEILRNIEAKALSIRENQPEEVFMTIESPISDISLPMDRKLYIPTTKARIKAVVENADDSEIDASALFAQNVVDKDALAALIRKSLQERSQISLSDLISEHPLEHGLAELVVYLQLATEEFESVIDDDLRDMTNWLTDEGTAKMAMIPRVIFCSSRRS